jgi:ketosteroid isomerase-like protein
MMDHPHAKLAKTAWLAASEGDVGVLARIFSEGVVWHASGRGPHDYRGQQAVFEYLASIGEAADRFDSDLEEILVGDEKAAVLFRIRGRRGERRLDTRFILIFRIEGGRIAEVWAVPRDQYAIDDFWA